MPQQHSAIADIDFRHTLRPRIAINPRLRKQRPGNLLVVELADAEIGQPHLDKELVAVHHRPDSNQRIGLRILAACRASGDRIPAPRRAKSAGHPPVPASATSADELKLLRLGHWVFVGGIHDVLCQIDLVEQVRLVGGCSFAVRSWISLPASAAAGRAGFGGRAVASSCWALAASGVVVSSRGANSTARQIRLQHNAPGQRTADRANIAGSDEKVLAVGPKEMNRPRGALPWASGRTVELPQHDNEWCGGVNQSSGRPCRLAYAGRAAIFPPRSRSPGPRL